MSDFDINTLWQDSQDDHLEVAKLSFESLQDDFSAILDMAERTIRGGGTILFFGNGGSASDAQHLATELTIRYKKDRAPIAALALTTDTSALTAGGNDLGFDQIFARQLDALGRAGDLAIGLSTSGNSANVIEAFKIARHKDIQTVAFTGQSGGALVNYSDAMLKIPSSVTARIQEMHIVIGHTICHLIDQAFSDSTQT